MSDHTEVNRAFWDEIAPHHAESDFYAVEEFLTTQDSLGEIEKSEVGSVSGLTIIHLQCHIGLDTLSLARRGATVVGLDFSEESLKVARDLAARTETTADFVRADVLEAADVVHGPFDMVFTTRGVLMWIADLTRWAETCCRLLKPGGVFYLLDIHPLGMALQPSASGWTLESSYFGGGVPIVKSEDASYAVSDVGLEHQETHEFIHPIGDVVSALAAAGLVIDFLHEHPGDDHTPTSLDTASTTEPPQLPALYSLRAHRPHTS